MDIRKLNLHQLTKEQFRQLVDMELHCGLEPYTPEMLLDCIENLDTYACMDGDTVAGFITIHAHSRRMGGGLYIVNLNVAQPYRRRGIGQKLMITCCGLYPDSQGRRSVTLDVAKDNIPARRLYEKLGFVLTDIPSQNGDTDVVMIAKLDALCGKE